MTRFEFEQPRNLLRISYSGHVTVDEVRQLRPELDSLLQSVPKGFRLLVDMITLDEMDIDCASEIRLVMDGLRERGVAQIVRVIPDHWKDIGFAMMSRFHYSSKVSMQTVTTIEEAAKLLA